MTLSFMYDVFSGFVMEPGDVSSMYSESQAGSKREAVLEQISARGKDNKPSESIFDRW